MWDIVKTVIICYGILGLVELQEVDFYTFQIKSIDVVLQTLKKLSRNYSNCTCGAGSYSCYDFTITVDRKTDNCSVYGFLQSRNSSMPEQTIDVSTGLKYRLHSANPHEPVDNGNSKQIAIITVSSVAAVGVTGVGGYFLADVVRNVLQSNSYRI